MKLQELNEALNVLFVQVSFNPHPEDGESPGGSQIVGPFASKTERDKFIDTVEALNTELYDDNYAWTPIQHIDPYNPKQQFMSAKQFIDDFKDRYGDDFSE